ncbi:hypothetical protein V3C99_018186 [Haemonchus contortus]
MLQTLIIELKNSQLTGKDSCFPKPRQKSSSIKSGSSFISDREKADASEENFASVFAIDGTSDGVLSCSFCEVLQRLSEVFIDSHEVYKISKSHFRDQANLGCSTQAAVEQAAQCQDFEEKPCLTLQQLLLPDCEVA